MKQKRNDEIEEVVLDDVMMPNPGSSNVIPGSMSVNSYLEDILKNTRTCTHTHTCNPPGPDAAHTHICYHTHTQIVAPNEDGHSENKEHSNAKAKRPSGNREAVRKYREKKKAHTAYLEEEVKKLHLVNQQLIRKLQGQKLLEAEITRLRSLLIDLRGKIDNELGAFPFHHNPTSTSAIVKEGDFCKQPPGAAISMQCQTIFPCFPPYAGSMSHSGIVGNGKMFVSWEGNCQPAVVDCQTDSENVTNADGQALDSIQTLVSSAARGE